MSHLLEVLHEKDMAEVTKEEVFVEDTEARNTLESGIAIDTRKEKQVVRKQDLLIIPILFAMFFLGYLVSNSTSTLPEIALIYLPRTVEP